MQTSRNQRRVFLRQCALLGISALTAACSAPPPTPPSVAPTVVLHDARATAAPTAQRTATAAPVAVQPSQSRAKPAPGPRRFVDIGGREALIAAARAEGALIVSGLPHDWLNYDLVLDAFTATYGIPVTELTPNASASQVISQLVPAADAYDAVVPDVVDVFYPQQQRLVSDQLLQPYEHEHWEELADPLRHTDARWSSAYQGLLAFAVNKAAVAQSPRSWTDLQSPLYRGQFALTGDPTSSAQALHSVYAASLAAAPTLDDGSAALAVYANLRKAGILLPGVATTASFLAGETPIIPAWSYTAHALRAQAGSNPAVDIVVPSPTLAGAFIHGINAYAAHPYAARLWIEHLFSDDVQMRWATAYAYPSRIDALATSATYRALLTPLGFDAIPRDGIVVPSSADHRTAAARISSQWQSMVVSAQP